MGIYTNIDFFNASDSKFVAAKNGTQEEREKWEDDNGKIANRPGARIEAGSLDFDTHECIEETDDEYGGWIIDLSKLPPNTTHIVVHRG